MELEAWSQPLAVFCLGGPLFEPLMAVDAAAGQPGLVLNPHRDRTALAVELAPAGVVRVHRFLDVFGQVHKFGVGFADFHPLATADPVAEQHRHGVGVFGIAQPGPANPVPVVKIVVLEPVGVMAAGIQKFVDQRAVRGHDDPIGLPVPASVLVLSAVIVGVEHAGIAFPPQEDQGVG